MAHNLALMVVGVLLSPLLVHAIPQDAYPNLIANPADCWNRTEARPSHLRICDPDKLVSPAQALELSELAASVKAKTECPCVRDICHVSRLMGRDDGFTVTLALVRTMGTNFNTIDTAKRYAEFLRSVERGYYDRYYNRCNEDVLIFLAYDQQVVYVLTGSSTRMYVKDEEITEIISKAGNSFSKSIFDGLSHIVNSIRQELPPRTS